MRPGQLRPGNVGRVDLDGEALEPNTCFNEAGAASPRKFAVGMSLSRRAHFATVRFNEAGAASPRKWRSYRLGPRRGQDQSSFNEAGAASPRKSRTMVVDDLVSCPDRRFNEAGAASPRKFIWIKLPDPGRMLFELQ